MQISKNIYKVPQSVKRCWVSC